MIAYVVSTTIGVLAIVVVAMLLAVDPQTRVEDAFCAGPFGGAR